jgi:hypothetical protein
MYTKLDIYVFIPASVVVCSVVTASVVVCTVVSATVVACLVVPASVSVWSVGSVFVVVCCGV